MWPHVAIGLATLTLVSAGCDPKCMENGNCLPTLGPHGGDDRGRERYLEELREAVENNKKACAAGDPKACGAMAENEEILGEPDETVEAHFAVACRGKVLITPRLSEHPCFRAGKAAERRGGASRAVAIERYSTGCAIGDGESCAAWGLLDPARAADHAAAACQLRVDDGCRDAVRIYADPKHRAYDLVRARAYMVIGCNLSLPDLCAVLGQLDAFAVPDEDPESDRCRHGDRDACEQLGREAARREPKKN